MAKRINSDSDSELSFLSDNSSPMDWLGSDSDGILANSRSPSPVVREEHFPGLNDLVSGAILPGHDRLRIPEDDQLDCSSDFEAQFRYMPFRILTSNAISKLFSDPVVTATILGRNFVTTNKGLERALMECKDTELTGHDLECLIIGALARRGGTMASAHEGRRVMYPEDMYPLLPVESPLLDSEYFDELYSRGEPWEESDCGCSAYGWFNQGNGSRI